MIFRLEPQSYWRVQSLYANLRYNLVVDSIFDGNTPAWVYVDDPNQPETALMWNTQDAILVAGRPDQVDVNLAFHQFILEQLIPDAKKRYVPELSLYYSAQKWDKMIDILLKGLQHQKALRRYYTSVHPKIDWRLKIHPDCEMKSINLSILKNERMGNVEQVRRWVLSFWGSMEDFLGTGFGYCLLYQGIIISWCLSVYASENHYELGVATIPGFQYQGYATLVAAACVEHCAVNRFVAHWHCWEDNLASIAVAEKVGFERPLGYSVYKFVTG